MALADVTYYWKPTETSGNRTDMVSGLTLTDNNTVGNGTGILGNAFDFERDNSESMSVASNATLQLGDISASWSVWLKIESDNVYMMVFIKDDNAGSDRDYGMYLENNKPVFYTFTVAGSYIAVDSGVTLSAGTWYNVTCWHDATNDLIGVAVNNGTPVTQANTGGVRASTSTFHLGIDGGTSYYYDGLLCEFGYWKNYVFNSTDRTTLYGGGTPPSYETLTGAGGSAVPVFLNHLMNQG
jgi:hypothetical protein